MNLHAYLNSSDAIPITALAASIGIKNAAQLRQWQHGYAGRIPGPENCVALEQVTNGAIRRWDLRPNDWHLIWPELIGIDGAPTVAEKQEG